MQNGSRKQGTGNSEAWNDEQGEVQPREHAWSNDSWRRDSQKSSSTVPNAARTTTGADRAGR